MRTGSGGEEWAALDAGGSGKVSEAASEVLATAQDRIERHRKSDVVLRLTDRSGTPVRGVALSVKQLTHDFPVGDQTDPLDGMIRSGLGNSDRSLFWKRRFGECLNSATALCYWTERPEHDMSKTEDRQGDLRLSHMRSVVEWAASEGLHVKGHPLFWAIPKCWPAWLMRYDTETQMKFAEVRIRSLLAAFGKQVSTWDLVNEALWEPAPENLASREWPHLEPASRIAAYVSRVLAWCREETPGNTFVLNDYGMEQDGPQPPCASDGTEVTAALQRQRMLEVLNELDRVQLMPDALGLQSHTGGLMDPAEQMAVYDELSQAGIPLHITEFWARRDLFAGPDAVVADPGAGSGKRYMSGYDEIEEARAAYIVRYLTVAFSHPAVEAFSFWGFMSDSIDWSERTASHSPGPVYRAVQALLNEQWRSNVDVRTDEHGCVRFRAFHGAYEVGLAKGPDGPPPAAARFRVAADATNEISVSGRRIGLT